MPVSDHRRPQGLLSSLGPQTIVIARIGVCVGSAPTVRGAASGDVPVSTASEHRPLLQLSFLFQSPVSPGLRHHVCPFGSSGCHRGVGRGAAICCVGSPAGGARGGGTRRAIPRCRCQGGPHAPADGGCHWGGRPDRLRAADADRQVRGGDHRLWVCHGRQRRAATVASLVGWVILVCEYACSGGTIRGGAPRLTIWSVFFPVLRPYEIVSACACGVSCAVCMFLTLLWFCFAGVLCVYFSLQWRDVGEGPARPPSAD